MISLAIRYPRRMCENFELCTLVNPSVRGRVLQLSGLRQWALMGDEQFKLSLRLTLQVRMYVLTGRFLLDAFVSATAEKDLSVGKRI